jgi:putative transposase
MRTLQLITGNFYHIFNRGVDKRKIFLRYGHYQRFIKTIRNILDTGSATQRLIYNQSLALKYKVKIHAYCLMPNHYHFLIQQTADNGITDFMHNLDTSYTKFINLNTHRSGRMFEYTFKAKAIASNELLLHVSRYIHLNPLINHITETLDFYPWSSYFDYTGLRKDSLCEISTILSFFQNDTNKYRAFVADQIEYARLLAEIKDNLIDEDAIFI